MTIFNSIDRPGGRASAGLRRGNSIILVIGLIVLLLIIAISFITRAQGLRSTAAAYRDASVHDGSGDSIARHIAKNVADSLFVENIDPLDETGQVVIGPVNEDVRIKPDSDESRYGVDPNFSWNYAPWSVVPWTNPPDWLTYPNKVGLQNEYYNAGSAFEALDPFVWNDSLFAGPVLPSRQNPRGGPGVSDTRWLRDLEPQRQSTQRDLDGDVQDGFDARYADSFSHWRHLTNLSRPNNEWRIVRDIADVTGIRSGDLSWDSNLEMSRRGNWSGGGWETSSIDGHHYHGGLVERLDVPVEQWPAQPPTNTQGELLNGREGSGFVSVDSGQNAFTDPEDFWSRWMRWFDPEGYRDAMLAVAGNPGSAVFDSGYEYPVGDRIPPNFYDLSDLDGDGKDGEYYDPAIPGKLGEKPEDEYRKGTARWHVGRVLTDTDGDGFTDSFWWHSPHMAPSGLRQVVGVSVTDNAGRLNSNVATRFIRNDTSNQEGTRGWGPSELALIGQGTPPFESPWEQTDAISAAYLEPNGELLDNWSVGFFDNRENWSGLLTSDTYPAGSPLNSIGTDWLSHPDAIDEEDGGTTSSEVFVAFNPQSYQGDQTLQDLMSELNIDRNRVFPDYIGGRETHDRNNRLYYFQQSGLNPFEPGGFFTPMGLSEELELRAYEGNNLPWLYGRFEQPINPEWSQDPFSNDIVPSFLRSGQDREEVSALGEQLGNRQLLADNRRKLTFFNSTRNDTMPPWLWPENRVGRVSLADSMRRTRVYDADPALDELLDVDGDDVADEGFPLFVPYARDMLQQQPMTSLVNDSGFWTPATAGNPVEKVTWEDYFKSSQQKIDLREWERPLPRKQLSVDTLPPGDAYQGLSFSKRLPMAILMALTSGNIRDSWSNRFLSGFPTDEYDAFSYTSKSPRETGDGGGVILRKTPANTIQFEDSGDRYRLPRHYSGDINFEEARQDAAVLAANMQAWRDPDHDAPVYTMGWFDANGQPRGNIGAVDLPRLDGWALNTDTLDPEYDSNWGDWRPSVEDMFIDAHRDDDNSAISDQANFDFIYQPFDGRSNLGTCVIDQTTTSNETLEGCRALGGVFIAGLSAQSLDDQRAIGSCCYEASALDANLESYTACQDWDGPSMNYKVCYGIGGRWVPELTCADLDCRQYESLLNLPRNVESPYRGDDFDGLGYPRLFDATMANDGVGDQDRFLNLADPYRFASGDNSAGSAGNWVNGADGYSPQELNTRATVRNVRALGMEPQPFITEAFVSHVVRPTRIPNKGAPGWFPRGFQTANNMGEPNNQSHNIWSDENPMWLVVEGDRLDAGSLGPLEPSEDQDNPSPGESPAGVGYMPDPAPADTIAVVQIANPYDEPIPLFDRVVDSSGQVRWLPRYKIRLFGQEFPLSPSINPQTEGRVSSLRGLINAGANADALDAGLLIDSSLNFNTKHGMVLPPATNDRPYTLTIVSAPAARTDEFDEDRKRWSFFMEDSDTTNRGELDQWIDFLDLGLDNGILNGAANDLLPQQTFQFEGEDYTVAQTDLIWVVRPAIDPAGDGAFDPNNASDDWDRDENDDVREIWATNRLYYDGKQDPWTQFNGDADLPIPYAWNAEDGGVYEPRRSFLKKIVDGSGNTTWTPQHTAVELVKVDRLDFNGDLLYNDNAVNGSISMPGGGNYEYRYEYGDEPVNPNTGEFSLMFENSDGGYPAQEIVIDRTLQQRADGTWHDPLMESIVGLEWGKSYNFGTNEQVVDFDEYFPGSLAASRLPSLDENPDWIDWQTTRSSYLPNTPQYDNITQSWVNTDGDLAQTAYYPIIWHGHSTIGDNAFDSIKLGQSFDQMNSIPGVPGNLYPGWVAESEYRDGKAASSRFAQWARYARPWGLDPDWTGVDVSDDDVFNTAPEDTQNWSTYPPEYQMEYAAPRYVLGRGAVTRSHSGSWFASNAKEQLTTDELPDLEDPTMPLVDRDYLEIAREAARENPALGSTRYIEQRIVQGGRGGPASINEFDDGKGHVIDVYVIDNDNSTAARNALENIYTGVDEDDYPSAKDFMEARGGGLADDASAKHYEHFEIASKFSGYGDEANQLDPDGDFTGGSYAANSHWPWLSRNARLPRYIANPSAPLANFAYIYRNRKPTAFDMIAVENYQNGAGWDGNNPWSFPDKGVYAVDETPAFDARASNYIYDIDSNGGYRYDENHLAPYSFQMNHKNGNFEQIGEVLNVWTHAHMISQPYRDYEYPGQPQFIPRPDPRVQAQTLRTFSESLSRELDETLEAARGPISYKVQVDVASQNSGGIGANPGPDLNRYAYRDLMRDALRRVGRLEVSPDAYGRQQLVGEPSRDLASEGSQTLPDRLEPWVLPNTDLSHLEPIQPAGQRVLDLFVCDGPGVYDLFNNDSYESGTFVTTPDGIIDPENAYQEFTSRDPSFRNAHGFTGKGTPGLVNINTASLEVLRTLPHMYRMVHGTDGFNGYDDVLDVDFSGGNVANRNPRVAVPEAMIQYRDQLGVHPTDNGPTRSAPFVGGKQVVLEDGFQSSLDSDRNGTVEPWEYGLNPGLDLGPSYAMRGAHTPVNHLGDSLRTDTANLTLDYFSRTDAGYDAFNDWTYDADGIATGSGVRGFQGIGELFQLQSPGYRGNPNHTNIGNTGEEDVLGLQGDRVDPDAWSIEFAAKRPFMFSRQESSDDNVYIDAFGDSPLQDTRRNTPFAFNDIGAAISTDTSSIRDTRQGSNDVQYLHGKPHSWVSLGDTDARKRERLLSGDMVAGDAEEANLLFSGLSNMITTRSDMFTVHFRVRTFKPNAETGVWDATDPDAIVDDSRYVMLVDRSEVENPGDQPRIVYMEKIDN